MSTESTTGSVPADQHRTVELWREWCVGEDAEHGRNDSTTAIRSTQCHQAIRSGRVHAECASSTGPEYDGRIAARGCVEEATAQDPKIKGGGQIRVDGYHGEPVGVGDRYERRPAGH